MLAVINGNQRIADFLYNKGEFNIIEENDAGMTALHSACLNGDEKMCEYLLVCGADEGKTDKKGLLPIHHAVLKDNANILKSFKSTTACP